MNSVIKQESYMLQLRPNCECCDCDLPPDTAEARICSFECTFCAACVDHALHGTCPNCGGGFAPRPTRAAAWLLKHPGSSERVSKDHPGCPPRQVEVDSALGSHIRQELAR